MSVMLESTDNNRLFQQMIHEDISTVDGSIEVLSGDDEVCVRRIEFKEAYIYAYGEDMQSYSRLPMTTNVSISPMRMDFNDRLKIDRRWPDYNGWGKVKEEVKYVRAKSVPNTRMTDAYWIDGKNNEVRELFLNHPVTLFVAFENYTTNKTINLKFENEDKTHSFEHSGVVEPNGIMKIENFQLKQNR